MMDFLLKSSISLIVFLVFYHLVLEREKMHYFNRFYLLLSIIVSFVIPFLTFEFIKIVPVVQNFEPSNTVMSVSAIVENKIQENINLTPFILWGLYGMISFLLLVRFGKNIWKLISKSKSNPIVKFKKANLILVEEKTLPHTFLNSIFINFNDYNNQNIEDELYTHEMVHVTQKHTLDILFIEFLKVVFWFNPLFIFYKKAIQLNHEFLADEEIVKTYSNVPFYQHLILQKGFGTQTIYLASNLNYLVTKKRLIMMTKSTSQKIALLKKVAVLPILAALIYFLCVEVLAQEKISNGNYEPGISEISDKDKIRDTYYEGVWVKIYDEIANKKFTILYDNLTLDEKRRYLNFVPDLIVEKEVPELFFQKLKTKDMAVWINDKLSSKEEISKFKRTDFVYYSYSFIHKNARTKRFPQEYQHTLYTKEYFDKKLKNVHTHYPSDTIKIGIMKYNESKVINYFNSDSVISYPTGKKDEYNLYIKESRKRDTVK